MKDKKNMDQNTELVNANIEDLVKTSKQVQNKMRQDLQTLSSSHVGFSEREGLPPIWDSLILDPYVKNIVADHIMEISHRTQGTSRPIESSVRTEPEMSMRSQEFQLNEPKLVTRSFPRSHVRKIVELPESYSTQRSQSNVATARSQVNEVHTSASVSKIIEIQSSVKKGTIGYSKHSQQSKKSSKNKAPRKRELPLQRFAGSSLETIDFSKEHPNLELYTSPNQSTVFPRRLHKNLRGTFSHSFNSPNEISINLAAAKMKEPKITPPKIESPHLLQPNKELYVKPPQRKTVSQVEEKTWKDVFMKNKSREKPRRTLHSKVASTVEDSPKKASVAEERKGIDIICTPYRGLYRLENEGEQLSKQKKCNLQRLPVMYIRPECQVQRVAKISIHDDRCSNENTFENAPQNVGYVECRHEDTRREEKVIKTVADHIQACDHKLAQPSRVDNAVLTNNAKLSTVKPSNKFIEALESPEFLLSKSGTSYSSLQSGKFSLISTLVDSLHSPTEASTVPTSTSYETTKLHIKCEMAKKITRPKQQSSEPIKSSVGVQYDPKEVYIQTNGPKSPPAVDPPVPPDVPSLVLLDDSARSIVNTDGPSASPLDETPSPVVENGSQTYDKESLFEDDFIGKIFERIRNDASDGLKEFKQRKHSHPTEAEFSKKQERKRDRREKSTMTPLPRVELFFDDETHEQCRQMPHRQHESQEIEREPKYPQSEKNKSRQAAERTIDKGKAKEPSKKYPMEKEIKRAVRIFLDSLTSEKGDGYSGYERTRDDPIWPLSLDHEQRKLKFLRLEPTSRTRTVNYDSSSSSEKKSEGSMDNSPSYEEFIFFSQATESSFSSEEGSDSTEPSKESTRSRNMRSDSLSEGEVRSIGEV